MRTPTTHIGKWIGLREVTLLVALLVGTFLAYLVFTSATVTAAPLPGEEVAATNLGDRLAYYVVEPGFATVQTFTPERDGWVSGAEINGFSTPNAAPKVEIRPIIEDGYPAQALMGAPIATGTVALPQREGSTNTRVNFDSTGPLIAGKKYALLLYGPGSGAYPDSYAAWSVRASTSGTYESTYAGGEPGDVNPNTPNDTFSYYEDAGNWGDYIFVVYVTPEQPQAPLVTLEPSDAHITYGQDATFEAAATGTPPWPLTVQWQISKGSGWYDISGATSTIYTLTKPQVSISGYQYRYRAVFHNIAGTATTREAILWVNPAPTQITWNDPAPIEFGTPLGTDQLDATADVPGTFTYSPPAGEVLDVGTHTLNVDFTPSDLTNYLPSSKALSITVNKASQTITGFDPIGAKAVGDNFQVSATASSGLPVSFAASGANCTISSDTVTVTGAGSCTITASQAGDANYNPAPDVSQSFKSRGHLPGENPPGAENPPGENPPGGEKTAICHKPGTPAEKTFFVPSSKVDRRIEHGNYTRGACE